MGPAAPGLGAVGTGPGAGAQRRSGRDGSARSLRRFDPHLDAHLAFAAFQALNASLNPLCQARRATAYAGGRRVRGPPGGLSSEDAVMCQNFITADREQALLMPPALVDWLPDEHLGWTVPGAVEQKDLGTLYRAYRANGQGHTAMYDPQVMLSLLHYAHANGVSSSRQVEQCCEVDIAFKVINAMRAPDHSTIAEFRRHHQDAIAEVFAQILALCAEVALVKVRGDRDRWDEDRRQRVA